MKLTQTKNDLPVATREAIATLCNAHLANSVDLQTQAKQAHWNVKGPQFAALHELFDRVAEDVEDYVDALAERVVQVGGTAEGTAHVAARASRLPRYAGDAQSGSGHADALATALAAYGGLVRAAIDVADELRDKDTADLFTEISRGVDRWLWQVEAHTWTRD